MTSQQHCVKVGMLVGLVLLNGCAVIETQPGTKGVGVAYSLPKGQVAITAERKYVMPADAAKAQKAADEAAALVEADKKLLGEAKDKLKTDQGVLENLSGADPETIAKAKRQVDLDAAMVKLLTGKLAADQKLAVLAKATAEAAARGVGELQETATLTMLPVVPDSDRIARYVANLEHIPTRDETVKLAIVNGMLSSSDMTSADRTGDIIVKLAEIASLFAGPVPLPASTPQILTEGVEPPRKTCPTYHISGIFDPINKKEIGSINDALALKESSFAVAVSPDPLDPAELNRPPRLPDASHVETDGLYYRSPISITVSTTVTPNQMCEMPSVPAQQSLLAVVPDTSQTFIVPMTASIFTTTKQGATFKDGMLTSYSADKPSEVLAALGIPIEVARALVSIPTEFLQLKVDYDNTAAAEVNAQVEQLKAELEALKAAQALENAKQGNAPADEGATNY